MKKEFGAELGEGVREGSVLSFVFLFLTCLDQLFWLK